MCAIYRIAIFQLTINRLLDSLVVECWLHRLLDSLVVECGRSRVQSTVKTRLLDSLVVECWLRVREVPGSIPSQ